MSRAEVSPDTPKPSDVAIAALDDVRQALLAPPMLALPKAKGQMIVDVDACADQLGCTLLQERPDGTRFPVGYWSSGLSPSEINYSTMERECLGVMWRVLKLRQFLDGHRFPIRTDHQALSWIYSTTESSCRLMRWRLRLSEKSFDLQYKHGASHHAPDFLSRMDSDAALEDINDDIPCLASSSLPAQPIGSHRSPSPIEATGWACLTSVGALRFLIGTTFGWAFRPHSRLGLAARSREAPGSFHPFSRPRSTYVM